MAAFLRHRGVEGEGALVTTTQVIRILIAEDHLIARVGVSTIIGAQPDMRVIAEATDGEQAVALYHQHRPDIVLMDMRMPVMNGFEAVMVIRSQFPDARIVALSTFAGDEDIRRGFVAGVRSYLTKEVLHDELIHAIRAVHAGERYLPPTVAAALAAQLPRPDLSPREMDVLVAIVQGLGNKQIAYILGIAEYTVKNHVKNIFTKLGAEDRTQAATLAIQRGIVHLHQ
jgi:DNA-binding NarL/FixJ family response regulator